MDDVMERVLREYEARAQAEEPVIAQAYERGAMQEQRDQFLLSVGRSTGTLLNILVRESGATRVLEIGSSYGYSTIWLADAVRATGGRLTTLELRPEKVAYAQEHLRRAGLDRQVDFRLGDARDSLAALSGPFDFVLIDLWKDLYIPCFDLVHPKLTPGAIVVADNMLHPDATIRQANEYRAHLRRRKDMESVLLPVGSGIEISVKSRIPNP